MKKEHIILCFSPFFTFSLLVNFFRDNKILLANTQFVWYITYRKKSLTTETEGIAMRKNLCLMLSALFVLVLLCGCKEENTVSNESVVNESLSESSESIISDVSEEASSSEEESSHTEDTVSDEDTTSVDEESAAFEALISQLEFPEYDAPKNVIYNTPSIIKKESYFTRMYPSINFGLVYETDGDKKCNLEKLVEKNLGNDDVWFYVAIRSCDVNTTMTFPIPTKQECLIDQIEGEKRLLDVGMIPNYEHFWSYSHVVKALPESEVLWQHPIVGYMTADMINELRDINKVEGYTYRILHLTEDKYFEEYLKDYDFREIIITEN